MKKLTLRETLLLLLVLSLIMWNALRLWTALAWQEVLTEFQSSPSPSVISVSAAFWILTGSILFWGQLAKKTWAWKMLLGVAAGYSVWYWTERLVWHQPHPNWTFSVVVNLLALAIILFNKNSLSREAYERKS